MPIRDFVCQSCGERQERFYSGGVETARYKSPVLSGEWQEFNPSFPPCRACGGDLELLERSNEGPGHTTHVRIK